MADEINAPENNSKQTGRVAVVFLVIGLLIVTTIVVFMYRYFKEAGEKQETPLATVETGEPAESSQDVAIDESLPTPSKSPILATPDLNKPESDKVLGFVGKNNPTLQKGGIIVSPTPTPTTKPAPTLSKPSGIEKTATNTTVTKNVKIAPGVWVAVNYKPGDITGSTHLVVRGDTLWEISEGKYGEGKQWKKIADINKVGYLRNGNPLIIPGTNLQLP